MHHLPFLLLGAAAKYLAARNAARRPSGTPPCRKCGEPPHRHTLCCGSHICNECIDEAVVMTTPNTARFSCPFCRRVRNLRT